MIVNRRVVCFGVVAFGFGQPNETRNQQSMSKKQLAIIDRVRVVSKRVAFGELFPSAEFPPTNELTPDAESESSRRFVFSAVLETTCDDLSVQESSRFVAREHRPVRSSLRCSPKLSRSRFNRGLWVSNLVQFGVAKRTGFRMSDFESSRRRSPTLAGSHSAINRATPIAGRSCSRWLRPPAIARIVNLRRVVQPR